MNFESARENMIKNQLRACNVLDENLLAALQEIPRELFVPKTYQSLAFTDTQLSIGHGEVMMSPREEGLMLQSLHITSSDSILEVGTGTGYMTSLLARLGKHVTSMDIYADFIESAQQKLTGLGLSNVTFEARNVLDNPELSQQFDVVVLTGSVRELPQSIRDLANPNGRIFAIIGKDPMMEAVLLQKDHEYSLFDMNIKPLVSLNVTEKFSF